MGAPISMSWRGGRSAYRGDLGWVPRGYLLNEKIEEAAFGLTVGEHSEVIPTDVGFHIIRILARIEHTAFA